MPANANLGGHAIRIEENVAGARGLSIEIRNKASQSRLVSQAKQLSPKEAQSLMNEGHKYLDVRTEEEFSDGHPPGAYNVPLVLSGDTGMTPNPDFIAVVERCFRKDEPVIVGCRSGPRTVRAIQLMSEAGFSALSDCRAGWEGSRDAFGKLSPGWVKVGLPVATQPAKGRSYAELKK